MTREDAIAILNHNVSACLHGTEWGEALEMAIKTLEQEPCEDAISRQAVNKLVDELARAISDKRCRISRGRSTATIMQDICNLPPVTPTQKIGYWKRINNSDGNLKTYVCSECGAYSGHKQKYCEECGTKMDGEKMEGEE